MILTDYVKNPPRTLCQSYHYMVYVTLLTSLNKSFLSQVDLKFAFPWSTRFTLRVVLSTVLPLVSNHKMTTHFMNLGFRIETFIDCRSIYSGWKPVVI